MPRYLPTNHSTGVAYKGGKQPIVSDLYSCDYPYCNHIFSILNHEIRKCNQCQSHFCHQHDGVLFDSHKTKIASISTSDSEEEEEVDEVEEDGKQTSTIPRGCCLCSEHMDWVGKRVFKSHDLLKHLLLKLNKTQKELEQEYRMELKGDFKAIQKPDVTSMTSEEYHKLKQDREKALQDNLKKMERGC